MIGKTVRSKIISNLFPRILTYLIESNEHHSVEVLQNMTLTQDS